MVDKKLIDITPDTTPDIDDIIYGTDSAGAVDMQAGDLTITWHGSGIFTIT